MPDSQQNKERKRNKRRHTKIHKYKVQEDIMVPADLNVLQTVVPLILAFQLDHISCSGGSFVIGG